MKYRYNEVFRRCLNDPALWTRISAGAQFSPDMQTVETPIRIPGLKDLNAWPWWANLLKWTSSGESLVTGRRDLGIGDTIERFTRWTGIQLVKNLLKINCQCDSRKHQLNRRYPYLMAFLLGLWTLDCGLCTSAQPIAQLMTNPAVPPPLLSPVQPMPGPKPAADLNPAHASIVQPMLVVTNPPSSNVILVAIPPLDTNANAINWYSTTDDVHYIYQGQTPITNWLGTNGPTITLSNQIGTNGYIATCVDTRGNYPESLPSDELVIPIPPPAPAITNLIITLQTPCTNPIVLETVDLKTFIVTTNFASLNGGTNLQIPIGTSAMTFYDIFDAKSNRLNRVIKPQ